MESGYNLDVKVSELGEFGLIELLAAKIGVTEDNAVLIGIGDDAACWHAGGLQIATTDSMIQDVHFDLKHTGWRDLGWKAMAVNLSDIAAMGGRPLYALVTLGLPDDIDVENIVEMYEGMIEMAKKFDVRIVGGDMAGSPVTMITLTVTGEAENEDLLLKRSAAVPGDMVAVTGYLGASAAGLAMIHGGLSFDRKTADALREAHFRPNPRVDEGRALAKCGVKAAMDVSDGLLADLEKLCLVSGTGARLYSDRVPINPAVKRSFGDKAFDLALTGGEDYELLFTAPQPIIEEVVNALACRTTIIGEIVGGKGVKVLDEDGKEFSFESAGWDHFARGKSA